jgi:hypothetical protein
VAREFALDEEDRRLQRSRLSLYQSSSDIFGLPAGFDPLRRHSFNPLLAPAVSAAGALPNTPGSAAVQASSVPSSFMTGARGILKSSPSVTFSSPVVSSSVSVPGPMTSLTIPPDVPTAAASGARKGSVIPPPPNKAPPTPPSLPPATPTTRRVWPFGRTADSGVSSAGGQTG